MRNLMILLMIILLWMCFGFHYKKGESDAMRNFYNFCKSENLYEAESFFIHCEIIEKDNKNGKTI